MPRHRRGERGHPREGGRGAKVRTALCTVIGKEQGVSAVDEVRKVSLRGTARGLGAYQTLTLRGSQGAIWGHLGPLEPSGISITWGLDETTDSQRPRVGPSDLWFHECFGEVGGSPSSRSQRWGGEVAVGNPGGTQREQVRRFGQ